MTRESEFCYIAERADGVMLMAVTNDRTFDGTFWTRDPEMGLRISAAGQVRVLNAIPVEWQNSKSAAIGFRKILKG